MAVRSPGYEVGAQVAAYQGRIRRDRRALYLSVAALVVAAYWLVVALLFYFDVLPGFAPLLGLGLLLLIPGALLLEWLQRPSLAGTAAMIDSRLDGRERLATAVQLLDERQPTTVARAQLESTADLLLRVDPARVYPERKPWPALASSAGILLLAGGILLLKGALGDFTPFQSSTLPPNQNNQSALATPTPPSNLPGAEPPSSSDGNPLGGPGDGNNSGNNSPSNGNSQDASQQAADSAAAKAGLDELAKELDGQSAAQSAADAIKQGDYNQAGQDLAELGQENDQLSDRAKYDLAKALENAANNPATSPDLQQAEQNAADALQTGDYNEIAEALKDLGNAVQDAGQQVVPQGDLAKNYPATPEALNPGDQNGQQGDQNGDNASGDQPGSQGDQPGAGTDNNSGDNANNGDSGDGSQNGDGNGGQPSDSGTRVTGPGTEQTATGVGDNPFELENQPDPNNRTPGESGTDNPGLTLEGDGGSSSGSGNRTTGNASTAPGESPNQPIERWPVIQKYFEHGQ